MQNETYKLVHICFPTHQQVDNNLIKINQQLNTKISGIKEIKKGTFHITLLFLGTLDTNQIRDVTEIIEKLVSGNLELFKNIQIKTKKISFFDNKHAKVIFLEVIRDEKLIQINKLLKGKLKAFIEKNENEFIPHITLARIYKNHKSENINNKLGDILSNINVPDITYSPDQLILRGKNIETNERTDLIVMGI